MRSLGWLFSKLITEVHGLHSTLTCADKLITSFEAEGDFSLRSDALTWFRALLQRGAVCSLRSLGGALLLWPSVGIAVDLSHQDLSL